MERTKSRFPRIRRLAIGLAVLVALGATTYWLIQPPALRNSLSPHDVAILRDTLNPNELAIIADSTRVEVFRVLPEKPKQPPEKEIGGYPITAVGKEQGPDFAKRLSAVLLSQGVTQNRKKCGLQPGVAFRLWHGQQAVDVLICFECDVLWPYVVGEKTENPWSQWQDFDPVRSDLVSLAKEAFPDDAEIRKLLKSTWP